MRSSDKFISPEVVERLCESAAEPLALLDPGGKLLSTNRAMDAKLASAEAPTEILESFCRNGAIDSDLLVSSRPSLADELQLVKLRLDESSIGMDEVVFLPWKAGYECGHELIDGQHQQLFVLGNGLIAASLDENTTAENFLGLIDELIAHVGQHFADEEKILASVGYSELGAHSRAHAGLVDKARTLRAKAENGTATSSEVIDFLVNSVVKNHMLTADKAFFGHLLPDQQAV